MESKREQVFVGVFVIVAIALLLFTLLYISGTFRSSGNLYRAYFKNAGGLQEGAQVRYAGGPPIGRVTSVEPDPQNVSQMKVEFRVEPKVPVKTDSAVKISSLSALGDNFLAIVPGTPAASLAPDGATLKTADYTSFDDITAAIADLTPQAKALITNLNARVTSLQTTIDRVNDLLNDTNRKNIAGVMAQANQMLAEDRKPLNATLNNMKDLTAKLSPMLDDFKKTMAKADDAISDADKMIKDDSQPLHDTLMKAHEALTSMASVTDQLDRTLNVNSGNLDEIIENFRKVSENMKEFTETIKTRPYTLIRSSEPKPRQPGEAPPP